MELVMNVISKLEFEADGKESGTDGCGISSTN